MTTFKKGDVVICKKHEVSQKLVFDENGARVENYIDDYFFNREAVIEYTYKERMLAHGFESAEDKDEYGIKFLDNGKTLAWLNADDLVQKAPMNIFWNTMLNQQKETEEACREYGTEEERYKLALNKKREVEKEIAVIEYARFKRSGGFASETVGSFGCDHDGYYTKCPHCGEYTGNYDRKNLGLKVSEGVYKCEKCGNFFSYS